MRQAVECLCQNCHLKIRDTKNFLYSPLVICLTNIFLFASFNNSYAKAAVDLNSEFQFDRKKTVGSFDSASH